MTRTTATLVGFSAVALWALLALFTVATAPVPPSAFGRWMATVEALVKR